MHGGGAPLTSSSSDGHGSSSRGAIDLPVLMFHGQQGSRRRSHISDLDRAFSASFLKQKVQAVLKEPPDEVTLLMGGEPVADSQVLSRDNIDDKGELLALAFYHKPGRREWKWEEPWPDIAEVCSGKKKGSGGHSALHLHEHPGGPAASDPAGDPATCRGIDVLGEGLTASPEVEESLLKPCAIKLTIHPTLTWTVEEAQRVESGLLFKLDVHCRIIVGKRWHKRLVFVPVSPQTSILEVEERLTEWLGSSPDEWLIMLDDSVLEAGGRLEEYQVGAASALTAMAWFRNT